MSNSIQPMPYFEAKRFASKHNLVMKCVEYPELYFQMDKIYVYFFKKSDTAEIIPIEESIRDYYPDYDECYYKPASKVK